jgi:hypothetical protein
MLAALHACWSATNSRRVGRGACSASLCACVCLARAVVVSMHKLLVLRAGHVRSLHVKPCPVLGAYGGTWQSVLMMAPGRATLAVAGSSACT